MTTVMRVTETARTQIRRTLLEAGMRLFSTQGYGATTVDQITAAAGVAKGTFYNYFASKEDLALTVLVDHLSEIEQRFDQLLKGHPTTRERLAVLFDHLLPWIEQNPELTWLWAIENLRRGGAAPGAALWHRLCCRLLSEGQAQGDVRQGDAPERLALGLEGVLLAHVANWYHRGGTLSLREQLRAALDIYWRGVAAPAGPGASSPS
ncbi:MAG TPA: TetR/AcrR family transcriptional regulator [Limnochordia bacterium]